MSIAEAAVRPPHPVSFDVEYPERLSRLKTFFRLILAIPQFFAVYLLSIAFAILSFLAWFAILFTGRYPRAFFEFTSGVLRWEANVYSYMALLRDEYPPFSWDPGAYPLTLDIPMPERQSRFRLFIRYAASLPNQLVLSFVAIAWYFVTFGIWFVILIAGRYPRALFRFSVGTLRWMFRLMAYQYLLRDEFPPYSLKADARPGNEVISAIIGVPIFLLYLGFSLVMPFVGLLNQPDPVHVQRSVLETGAIERTPVSGDVGDLQITLLGYRDLADTGTFLWDHNGTEDLAEYRLVAFRVRAEKDGFWPEFYTSFLFNLESCLGETTSVHEGSDLSFRFFFVGSGQSEDDIYFPLRAGVPPCELSYYSPFGGPLRFVFE